MLPRTDLPANSRVAQEILLLERLYGPENVFWDRGGRWIQINGFAIRSNKRRWSHQSTYIILMVPEDYGERSGIGAGLEECYICPDLRVRQGAVLVDPPHTYNHIDRRRGAATRHHKYWCVHIHWDPRRHDARTTLQMFALFLEDPWAFQRVFD